MLSINDMYHITVSFFGIEEEPPQLLTAKPTFWQMIFTVALYSGATVFGLLFGYSLFKLLILLALLQGVDLR